MEIFLHQASDCIHHVEHVHSNKRYMKVDTLMYKYDSYPMEQCLLCDLFLYIKVLILRESEKRRKKISLNERGKEEKEKEKDAADHNARVARFQLIY